LIDPKGRTMNILTIKTEADYYAALKEIESLMPAEANTPEGERLAVLATLIETHEHAHFPLDSSAATFGTAAETLLK
jgi:antitoxin component HigA of HigAB toxin-antitoxin module